ncbi:Arginine deiminase [Giardia muris]|uniref:Arginine deiminase n=1 Tax=Giardia muris TaxID=5742 RepID=A0A4Z1SS11_GIAMU|nr:Arginine deiminase [Giardia muris]|eukprot:TNJ28712.1 Arginine deiminase [Giardia muris]
MQFTATQFSENDVAEVVVVHEPPPSSLLSMLNPIGSLCKKPFVPARAREDHRGLQTALEAAGCRVIRLSDALCAEVARNDLLELAMKHLEYNLLDHVPVADRIREYVSDEHKRYILTQLSSEDLVEVVLARPIVNLAPGRHNTSLLTRDTAVRGLSGLVFMRDQQIVTARGLVLGQFNADQRREETVVVELLWKVLGVPIVGRCSDGGSHCLLEGGDFVTMSADLAILGVGLRSTYDAAVYLMKNDLLGTQCFAVVKDCFDQSQDRMHLDCAFTLLHDRLVLVSDYIYEGKCQRYVDEYAVDAPGDTRFGRYALRCANIPFKDWLAAWGYTVITLPHEHQLHYGCNNLNLGGGRVLIAYAPTIELIKSDTRYKAYCVEHGLPDGLELIHVPFEGITSMYGSVHCATQVIQRRRSAGEEVFVPSASPNQTFDIVLYIPSGINKDALVAEGDAIATAAALLDEMYALYEKLQTEGKRVYLWPASNASVPTTARAAYGARNLTDIVARIIAGPEHTPRPRQGASTIHERVVGYTREDIVSPLA